MVRVQSTALIGFLVTLVLASTAVLAVNVTTSIDKNAVAPGGTLTVSGTITSDDGSPGNFDYRIAMVAPGKSDGGDRIIICDSKKQSTNGTSNVSLSCQIPTIEGLQQLGVENAANRFVIPLKGGIAVIDPAKNETVKKHVKSMIVNTEKLQTRLDNALDSLNAFIKRAEELGARCDNITAKAEEAGADNVVTRCANFQSKLNNQIERAANAKEKINDIIGRLNATSLLNFDNLKTSLTGFGEGAKNFKIETKDLREFVEKAKADLEKKVAKEIADRTKAKAAELRENFMKEKLKIQDRLKEIEKKESARNESTKVRESGGRK